MTMMENVASNSHLNKSVAPTAVVCLSSGDGGMERSAVRLARFLSTASDVVLICKYESFVEKLCREEACAAYQCETVNFLSRTFSVSMLFKARSIIRQRKIKNIIFFGASELKTLYFSLPGIDVNLIVWHGTTKSRPKRDFFHRLVYSKVNYHVALSEHLINNVKKIVPQINEKLYKVIRPSFDFEIVERQLNSGGLPKLRICHVGRLANGKGQIDAVRACKILKENDIDFKLTLVGSSDDDSYKGRLSDTISESGLKDDVEVTGYVESVNAYLENADILLFPSAGEGMPNSFIEALHYNIVCISYDNTVFPEFETMGFYVRLVKDQNLADLSLCLLDVVNNLSREKDRSYGNQKLASEYFKVSREIEEWKEILSS